jgi:hypothetical protein
MERLIQIFQFFHEVSAKLMERFKRSKIPNLPLFSGLIKAFVVDCTNTQQRY